VLAAVVAAVAEGQVLRVGLDGTLEGRLGDERIAVRLGPGETPLVTTNPGPEGEESSEDYQVRVNGKPVFVYRARVSAVPFNQVWPGYQRPLDQTEVASFGHWDMAGPVTVEVLSTRPVETVAIRPTSYGIRPTVEGHRIVFQILKPRQLVVEVNGTHRALHLFANPPEKKSPKRTALKARSFRHFGPGVHDAGNIELRSHETVYIADGAVVHGFIQGTEVSDVEILGRGILDVSHFKRTGRFNASGAIALQKCSNVKIEGIVIRDPNIWTVIVAGCRDVSIDNIKLIGLWRYNTDGIDLVNSQDVSIKDCFIRSFDDSLVIKGMKHWMDHSDKPVRNVTVAGCVIWNDWGKAIEIGFETSAPEIRDIAFEDCDIIRTGSVALNIANGDRATVSNVRYEDIRVEIDEAAYPPKIQRSLEEKYDLEKGPYCPRLLSFTVPKYNEYYSEDQRRGRIRDVLVKDVSVTGSLLPSSSLAGHDAEHGVEDVTIENLRVGGKPVRSADEGRFRIGQHVRNVKFVLRDPNIEP